MSGAASSPVDNGDVEHSVDNSLIRVIAGCTDRETVSLGSPL